MIVRAVFRLNRPCFIFIFLVNFNMKKIGIIGGISWQSTVEYYKILNELSEKKGDGFSTVDIIIYSLNFHNIEQLQKKNDWEGIKNIVKDVSLKLVKAGADVLIIASNTIHKILPDLRDIKDIKYISIIDAIAEFIKNKRLQKVALFGTKWTMEEDFYRTELSKKSGAEIIIPEKNDRETINTIIFTELTKNIINPESRIKMMKIIEKTGNEGAQAIVLGCTELPLLISEQDSPLMVLDSTKIHTEYTFNFIEKNDYH